MPRYSFESDGGGDEREAALGGHGSYYDPPTTTTTTTLQQLQQLRANRRLSRQAPDTAAGSPPHAPPANVTSPPTYQQAQQRYGVVPQQQQAPYYPPLSNITPGADNFGQAAAGGVAGIAYEVAERNARDSGVLAIHNNDQYHHHHHTTMPPPDNDPRPAPAAYAGEGGDRTSYSSMSTLHAAAVPMGQASPPGARPKSSAFGTYTDDPYQGYAGHSNVDLGYVDPSTIDDDGDDGLEYSRAHHPRKSIHQGGTAAGGGGALGAGAVLGALGGLVGRSSNNNNNNRDGSGQYNAVHNANNNTSYQGAGGAYDLGGDGAEKSAWLQKQGSSAKKYRWLLIGGVGVLLAAVIALGIYFGVVAKHQSGSGGSPAGPSAADDTADNGDLDIHSAEIQKLLNNKNLHKVFPGIDYTPINSQYPGCLKNPPSQNNVTRDLAVLSQLTNTIRLYGTDCNQTEMLLHAASRLEMNDTVKIWLGVWQDGNATTNARQLAQMWDILDAYGDAPFKGLIVANEVLFREQMTITELGDLLEEVRTNLTAKGLSLPVATSDAGDAWTADLAAKSDYIMANVHPFFGGVNARDAAGWTYSFWENHNRGFFKADAARNVIAETGWPSQGGTDCGTALVSDCPDGSVAGIDQMNTFLGGWVCQALANGTQYFWFESFDEPWKISYNSGSQNWEDHWGLMDVNRNLKSGVKIPDCDGKTVD